MFTWAPYTIVRHSCPISHLTDRWPVRRGCQLHGRSSRFVVSLVLRPHPSYGLGRVSTGLRFCVSVCFGGAGGVGGTLFNPVGIVFYQGEGGIWLTFTEKIQRQPSRASQPN